MLNIYLNVGGEDLRSGSNIQTYVAHASGSAGHQFPGACLGGSGLVHLKMFTLLAFLCQTQSCVHQYVVSRYNVTVQLPKFEVSIYIK